MRLSLLVHWLRGRPLVTVLALLLAVSALLVAFSDPSGTAVRSLQNGSRMQPIGHSDHVTLHDTRKFKAMGRSSAGDSLEFTGNIYSDESVADIKQEYESKQSVPGTDLEHSENRLSADGDYEYQNYNSKADTKDIQEEDATYTLVHDENLQIVPNKRRLSKRPQDTQVSLLERHFPHEVLADIKKYLYTGDPDPTDALFSPCEGPNIPEVKPQSIYGFLGPFRYLANYKNPCWMELRPDDVPIVHCVPYFYIAGAPKAGSTDLFKRVTMHPDVVPPSSKETRWFDRSRFADKPMFSSFLAHFKEASTVIARSLERGTNYHRRITGDGSPSYFFDNRQWPLIPGNEGCTEPRVTVASHIRHLYPKAKVIFILRNPVDRLYSSYLYNHAKYEIVNSQTFDQYVREAIKLYSECFDRFSVRHCANNATIFSQAKAMLIVSLYSVFVRDWLELFPREQILVLTTEKYNYNMKAQLANIFQFLELSPLNSTELDAIANISHYNRGNHYSEAGQMWPSTRALLDDFFRPYNQQLAHLLNDPDLLWM